ncbi:hypothetical protein ACFFLM_00205 [Deinococcus oregonensis]|uniref:Uncharacterized protein n=1 Tax=Deinococcus oregonensis TaxID=1805970 RepID=A0ABV6ASD8_9DEIO
MDLYVQRRATLALLVSRYSWQDTPRHSPLFLQLIDLYAEALSCQSLERLQAIEQHSLFLAGPPPLK